MTLTVVAATSPCCVNPSRPYLLPFFSPLLSTDLLPSGAQFNQVRTLISNLGRFSTNNQCVASGDAVVDMYTSGLSNGKVVGILLGYFFLFMTVTYLVVLKSSRKSGPSL